MLVRIPAHEATTAQLAAVYPFAASRQLPASKVLVGRDLLGGIFVHDPFELYAAGVLTNPNMLVIGQIGRGKSALVKTYLYRQAAFGRRVVVLDPKGEYGPLADALGVAPVALRPGGRLRLNPLDPPGPAAAPRGARGGGDTAETARRRLALLAGLASACLGRMLTPVEHTAVEIALGTVGARTASPVLPEVVEALLAPDEEAARSLRLRTGALRDGALDVALELRRLVHGELSGMFDGPTTPGIDLDGPAVVLDLSAVYHSPALGALMACAAAFVEAACERDATTQTVLVVDEAWAVLANLGVARFLQSSWKLARSRGIANVAVVHRVSDLAASGGTGSPESRIAEGLVADSETIVCYAQPPSELTAAGAALGLSDEEVALLAGLRRGVALWRVAGRSFLVEHRLGSRERSLVATDARLLAGSGPQ